MSKRNPAMFPDPEREAEAIEAFEKAQNLPPSEERTDALTVARQMRNAAIGYRQIFTDETRSRENG